MRRVFLSYHIPDRPVALALKQAIEAHAPDYSVFVDERSLRHGHFWQEQLFVEVRRASAFVILVGNRLGDWQKLEYYEALDRKAKEPSFTLLPIIISDRSKGLGQNLPGLAQLHWVESTEPTAPDPFRKIVNALAGTADGDDHRLWRMINPYRGLLALEEQDGDFFFGRTKETEQVLDAIMAHPNEMIALVGNSGVGKSSLIQAGVFGALKRQRWPTANRSWPSELRNSRAWAYLTIKPGDDPVEAITNAFIGLWFESATEPERVTRRNSWLELLQTGKGRVSDLIDATERRYRDELNLLPPERILLYIDQGEELYSRGGKETLKRFSELLAQALNDPRLSVIISQRSDYYGFLQANEVIFSRTICVDLAPLGLTALKVVLREPARSLGAIFESEQMIDLMVDAAADQPGALPLLADLMTELWEAMRGRNDGVIRILDKKEIIQVGASLARRADRFLEINPHAIDSVKRMFAFRLAIVQPKGEALRRRMSKSECNEEDWKVVQALAGPDWRLIVTSVEENSPAAEVAHEVLLRKWPTLARWLEEQRDFLIWRTEVERLSSTWQARGGKQKIESLLAGAQLRNAIHWKSVWPDHLPPRVTAFVDASLERKNKQRSTLRRAIFYLPFVGSVIMVAGGFYLSQYHAWLIEAKREALRAQGEIIAAAIAANASGESGRVVLDLDRLPAGERVTGRLVPQQLPILPERVTPILRRLVNVTDTRARIYGHDGTLIVDTGSHLSRGEVVRPETGALQERVKVRNTWTHFLSWVMRGDLPIYREIGSANGTVYPEVRMALTGSATPMLLVNDKGEQIVSQAVPIQLRQAIYGVLLLSTRPGEIDEILSEERNILILLMLISFAASLLVGFISFRLTTRILSLE